MKNGYAAKTRKKLRLRAETLAAYGGTCKCCGETIQEFLSIDHVDGGGNAHRRELFGDDRKGSGYHFYAWLKKQGFPQGGFQLLCRNCNAAKSEYGVCPHQR